MCNAKYLLIDTLTVMALTATMALAQPHARLAPQRPPASLLGVRVVALLAPLLAAGGRVARHR